MHHPYEEEKATIVFEDGQGKIFLRFSIGIGEKIIYLGSNKWRRGDNLKLVEFAWCSSI